MFHFILIAPKNIVLKVLEDLQDIFFGKYEMTLSYFRTAPLPIELWTLTLTEAKWGKRLWLSVTSRMSH